MSPALIENPILNSPYEYPARHWELGEDKQPTQRILDTRRRADRRTTGSTGVGRRAALIEDDPGLEPLAPDPQRCHGAHDASLILACSTSFHAHALSAPLRAESCMSSTEIER
ncbi:MAG: hypothetical protein HC788_06415, partial [Sphingopyxis sp.]|nr:hypothetical protein [Sphingopyxis sp.]